MAFVYYQGPSFSKWQFCHFRTVKVARKHPAMILGKWLLFIAIILGFRHLQNPANLWPNTTPAICGLSGIHDGNSVNLHFGIINTKNRYVYLNSLNPSVIFFFFFRYFCRIQSVFIHVAHMVYRPIPVLCIENTVRQKYNNLGTSQICPSHPSLL